MLRELEDQTVESAVQWAQQHPTLFAVPTAAEGAFVAQIYSVAHFQQNIEQRKILAAAGENADPFVIAKAAVEHRTVVTVEEFKPNAVQGAEYLARTSTSSAFL